MGLQGAEQVFCVEQTVTAVRLLQPMLTVDGAPLVGGGSGAASILPPMRRFGRATGPAVSKAEVVDKVNVLIQRFGDIVDPAALVEGQSA